MNDRRASSKRNKKNNVKISVITSSDSIGRTLVDQSSIVDSEHQERKLYRKDKDQAKGQKSSSLRLEDLIHKKEVNSDSAMEEMLLRPASLKEELNRNSSKIGDNYLNSEEFLKQNPHSLK